MEKERFIKVEYKFLNMGLDLTRAGILCYIKGFGEKGCKMSCKSHFAFFNLQPTELNTILSEFINLGFITRDEEGICRYLIN